MKIERLNPTTRWSDATVYNGIAHFVEIAADTHLDMAGQVSQIFKQAEATLSAINSDHSRLLSATIYITNFANLQTFNALWDAWLPQGGAPSRACIKAELAEPEYLVEIAFVAAVND